MKNYIKFICAFLLLFGTSAHAWGTGIYLEYNSTKYYDGQTVTINLAPTTLPAHGSPSMAVKNDAGWTQDTYSRYGIITTTLSGTSVPSNVSFLMGSYVASAGTAFGNVNETSYYTYNMNAPYWYASFQLGYYFAAAGTYDVTMTITETDQADGTTVLQSATITIRFVVTFSGYTITYNLTGLEHANPYNPTATSGEFHAEFELADNYSTPITGTYSDGFVTNAPITIGTSGDCYYYLGDLYYNATPVGNVTINLTATTTCTPLAAPTGLTVTENKDGEHGKTRFGWNSVANASGYKVTVSNGVTTASKTTASDRYYYITTFPAGNYTWSVSAIGDGSTYCEENEATAGSSFCVGADLSAVTPSNLAASSITNTSATISWDAVANATSYELLIVDEDETTIDAYEGSSTSWDVSGLTAGTTYTIWWQAVNSCDDSYNSNIDKSVSFTTTNNHTVSFNANGGSGSIDDVIRAHGTTYDLPGCTFVAPSGKVFKCWAEESAGGTERAVGYTHTVNADITFYAKWRDAVISDYVFSCADLSLTPRLVTDGTPIFITSTASKKVRSQDSIQITGSGLTPNTTLTFPGLPDKFEIKTATYGALSTDASGAIDVAAYIFYTPDAGSTTDGLDEIASITASVGGAKAKQVSLVQSIIGRHLPADFVIAGKKNDKWYALPATMSSTDHPAPAEIAVDDIDNPSIAYTDANNKYGLVGPTTGASSNISKGDGQYVKLTLHPLSDAPLFGQAPSGTAIGKSTDAIATNNLSAGWWWQLKQTNTSISNPQDAKYIIYCANNNTNHLRLKDNVGNPQWGLYDSGVEELRLIPASTVIPTEAEVVEWGLHAAIVEVNAQGVSATKVKAKLNGATSSLITLATTGTSVKGTATKYDYTVSFGDGIDFAANSGKMLTLEWYNSSDVMVAVSNILVPKIIASSASMSSIESGDTPWSKWEVHVLPGVTLTANAGSFTSSDVTIKQLEIYQGATVNVTTGTLDVTKLVLRNGWRRVNGKAYEVARLYITPTAGNLTVTNAYADWYIDFDQYYPIAVPWDVTVSNISYKNSNTTATIDGTSGTLRLRYYDGASRATNVQEGVSSGANWKAYGADGCRAVPAKLVPSVGYAMTAKRPTGKAFSIIRMPLTIPSSSWTAGGEQGYINSTHKDQVSITAYGSEETPEYAKGWNLIANPYMSLYQGTIEYAGGDKVNYVNIPDVDFKDYSQMPTALTKLKPASAFLVQAPSTGTVTFGSTNRKASAPGYRNNMKEETVPEQQAYININDESSSDMMGLWVADKYTAAYNANADLEKLLGEGTSLKTYMHFGDMDMAYLAINETLAKEWIPVLVRIPENGEYTFSLHDASTVDRLAGVYLIDHGNGDQVTNLITDNYTFFSTSGTISGRFAINATVGERMPTDVDVVNADEKNSSAPVKFIFHEKVYIMYNGVIYDATGKRVREVNK